ncbi:hypothetical protein ACFFX0_12945 [Citricoccus parietis]|uniref:Uncharacterized protein n=1 Tax=Citricoccus parietis TaxID=592307 RepID=A0ABV5FZG5_9MICC
MPASPRPRRRTNGPYRGRTPPTTGAGTRRYCPPDSGWPARPGRARARAPGAAIGERDGRRRARSTVPDAGRWLTLYRSARLTPRRRRPSWGSGTSSTRWPCGRRAGR